MVPLGGRAGCVGWRVVVPAPSAQRPAYSVQPACVLRACVVRACVVRAWCVRGACVWCVWCVCVWCVVRGGAWCVVVRVRGAWWCVVRVRVRGAVVTAFHVPNQNMDAL